MGLFSLLFGTKKNNAADTAPSLSHSQADQPFDWRTSEPHLLLLERFRYAAAIDDVLSRNWGNVLGEPPQVALQRFIDEGLIVTAGLVAKIGRAFKSADLKPFLKERGLPVSGRKEVLIERLVTADPDRMTEVVSHLHLLECSGDARLIVESYLDRKQAAKDAAVQDSMNLIYTNDFKEAVLVVSNYEARQVLKRGLGIEWSTYDPSADVDLITTIFTTKPKILNDLKEHEWKPLRIAAAMMHLWGTNRCAEWLPNGFDRTGRFDPDTACRMLIFHAQTVRNISEWREMGINEVTILSCGKDSCPACKRHADRKFSLDDTPELPCSSCTHSMGCRCEFLPVID